MSRVVVLFLAGCFVMLAAVLVSPTASAQCPAALADQKIPNTQWSAPSANSRGQQIGSSYDVGGAEYVITAKSPSTSEFVKMWRYRGSDHVALDTAVSAGSTASFDQSANAVRPVKTGTSTWNWMPAWMAQDIGNWYIPNVFVRPFSSGTFQPASQELPVASLTYSPNYQPGIIDFAVDRVPNQNFEVVAYLRHDASNPNPRPCFRIVNGVGGLLYTEKCVALGSGKRALDVAVDAFRWYPENSDRVALAWTEKDDATGTQTITFATFTYAGTQVGQTKTVTRVSNLKDRRPGIAVYGVTGSYSLAITWTRYEPGSDTISDVYYQPWGMNSAGPTTASANPIAVDDSAYTFGVSVRTPDSGNLMGRFAISYFQLLLVGTPSGGTEWIAYPTFKVFNGPADKTGAIYLSWYPHANLDYAKDRVAIEVFNGCADRLVVGGTFFSDWNSTPSSEWGVRRSFVSLMSSGLSMSLGMADSLTTISSSDTDPLNPFRALEGAGQVFLPGGL